MLKALRDGPVRLSALTAMYRGARDTIKQLRKELPPNYRIVGRYEKFNTKFGIVRDFVYRLEKS